MGHEMEAEFIKGFGRIVEYCGMRGPRSLPISC